MNAKTIALLVPIIGWSGIPAIPLAAENIRIITLDKRTLRPVPARISVSVDGVRQWGRDAEGKSIEYDGLPRVWSGGDITLTVPPGEAEVIASRPFACPPASAAVVILPGQNPSLTLALEAAVDLTARGWYGGDAHTHVVHGERHFAVDLRLAAFIARSEGLDWAAFGEVWTALEERQPSPAELTALCRELTDELFLCDWTQEFPKDHLGHMAAFPLGGERSFAGACGQNRYDGSLEQRESFTHFEIIRALEDLGSLSVYTHPAREYGGSEESLANIARELPFDAVAAPWALEGLDVLTDAPGNADSLKLWGFLLDRGHRLPACGFSDACYDRRRERPGDTRTYVSLKGGRRTTERIIAAIRAGRTFATTGPLVLAAIDGEEIGAVFPADGRRRQGRIEAWNVVDYADPRGPAAVSRVEVRRNGSPWREFPGGADLHQAVFTFEVEERETAWYTVWVHGSHPGQFAVTSPFYFDAPGRREPRPARAAVRGAVTGTDGEPLDGAVLAIEYGKDHRRVVAEGKIEEGKYRIECPASCRIEVRAGGHEPAMKSIYLDFDPIYRELFWPIRRERLWDPDFYAEIEKRLGDVVLDFKLKRRDG